LNAEEVTSLETKLRLFGLLICVLAPVAFLIVVWAVLVPREEMMTTDNEDTVFFVWILSAMAFAEPVIGYVLRKRLLNAEAILSRGSRSGLSQIIFAGHMVGYAFAISPAVFGLVVYLVTHNATLATAMICCSPLAYLFFRPTEGTVQELAHEVEARLASK
jgi:hypothetical protein